VISEKGCCFKGTYLFHLQGEARNQQAPASCWFIAGHTLQAKDGGEVVQACSAYIALQPRR
jgi:hypothetical protein